MDNNGKRFTLRLDSDIFEIIKERAKQNKRSVAKEMEYILEKYLETEQKEKSTN